MISAFLGLKQKEEGQALVLAAISMLILSLCVLSTVNLSYAAKERVELQNSADAAAYTTAAYQARAMNFFAYSNRAMTVHYAFDMNLLAVISYMGFSILLTGALAKIPWIGIIFQIINAIQSAYFWIIYVAAAVAVPFTDGINFGMSLMQTAIATSMSTDLLAIPQASVTQANPQYKADMMSSVLLTAAPAAIGINNVTNTDPTPSVGTFTTNTDPNAVLNRLIMTEIANSTRNNWVADGTSPPVLTLGIVPRKLGPWTLNFLVFSLSVGKVARTEWGSFNGGSAGSGIIGIIGGLLGGALNPTEQVYSDDTFFIHFSANLFIVKLEIDFDMYSRIHADRNLLSSLASLFGLGGNPPMAIKATIGPSQACTALIHIPFVSSSAICAPFNAVINIVKQPLTQAVNQIFASATQYIQTAEKIPIVHFGQVPYARFIPLAHVGPAGARSGLFNQPPVVLNVTAPGTYLQGKGQPFMGYFGMQLGGNLAAGQAVQDGPSLNSYGGSRGAITPSKRGFVSNVQFAPGNDSPFSWMQPGFHAMAASMAYYHRPGDWREPPNLFNPMWGAKLMPVGDYPTVQTNPVLSTLFTKNLMVH